jgi:hypothetical protein
VKIGFCYIFRKRNLFIHPVNKTKNEYLAAAIEPIELKHSIHDQLNKMIAQIDSPAFSPEYLKVSEHKTSYFDGPKSMIFYV